MNLEIANRLQKLRKENGYSQEELADKLGISRQAVSKWERAESSPDTDNLIILARLYNVSLDELLSDNESSEEIKNRIKDKEDIKNSIRLTDDEGQSVVFEDNKVKFFNKDGSEENINKGFLVAKGIYSGIVVFSTLIAFLLWGFLANGWYVSWVLWVLMPSLLSVMDCIEKKRFSAFAFPCLITALYCYLGMEFKLWHPYWILFLAIPVFYLITDPIDKYLLKTKPIEEE